MKKKPRINIEIDEKMKQEVKVRAASKGISLTDLIINYLTKWLRS